MQQGQVPRKDPKRMKQAQDDVEYLLNCIRQNQLQEVSISGTSIHSKLMNNLLKLIHIQKCAVEKDQLSKSPVDEDDIDFVNEKNRHIVSDISFFSIFQSLLHLSCQIVMDGHEDRELWATYQIIVCMLCAHMRATPEWIIDGQMCFQLSQLWQSSTTTYNQVLLNRALLDTMMLPPKTGNSEIDKEKDQKQRSLDAWFNRLPTTAMTAGVIIKTHGQFPEKREALLSWLNTNIVTTGQKGKLDGKEKESVTILDRLLEAGALSKIILLFLDEPWLLSGIVQKNMATYSRGNKDIIVAIQRSKLSKKERLSLVKYLSNY